MIDYYPNMLYAYWKKYEIKSLIEKFPDGQAAIQTNNQITGCALSLIVDYPKFCKKHTYQTGHEELHVQFYRPEW